MTVVKSYNKIGCLMSADGGWLCAHKQTLEEKVNILLIPDA